MKRISLYLIIGLFLMACSDFLEEYSQDQFHPTCALDLNELLIGSGYWQTIAFGGLEALSDDAREYRNGNFQGNPPSTYGFYTWAEFPYYDQDDAIWNNLYKSIGTANAIIEKIEEYSSDSLYNKVKGEAYFIRGASYFFLANLYAQPYAKEKASSTLGVPLKLVHWVVGKDWDRSPLDEVYEVVVSDLQMAATCLAGVSQPSVFRANENAAYALLSRVYLYMGEFENVIAMADKVLERNEYSVSNLAGVSSDSCFMNVAASEIIFSQGGRLCAIRDIANQGTDEFPYWHTTYQSYCVMPSKNLKQVYTLEDYRPGVFFRKNENTRFPEIQYPCYKEAYDASKPLSDYGTIRLSEVILNKAEAEAQLGQENVAKTLENFLRGRYEEIPVLPVAERDLVEWVRDERRRELCFEGHRWFDLRRYAVDAKYPFTKEILHVEYYQNENLYIGMEPRNVYRLAPYDEDNRNWCLPIPENETKLSTLMTQNERVSTSVIVYDKEKHEQYE
ncbi:MULTISPECIES: RagB/SusD family nutrient uptake outer membrane protein [Butyricimonas]|uniref:RagB/SusD family nutrient uptake outer membrane protein n=1 Tax=Butyricimonas TaxID=574697 RepID=UPI00165236D0|nr:MULTISPECIES: RagB/SusD family nutrient uptake outer membrane protein [Butyricimonas]